MTSRWSGILSQTFFERYEKEIVFVILALFLGFNILTAPFSPDVWGEEVSYTEPAAILAKTGRLTSHAWGEQIGSVWTGNAPLHQIFLAGFIKIFGFNCRTARGVNMLYYTLAVFFMYQMVRKHELIKKCGDRLLFIFVLLTGTGLVALYRNGRYDALGAFLVIFWAWCSLQSGRKPGFLIGTFITAVLMPLASLSIAPFLLVCGITSFCLWRWKTLYALSATGVGCLLGMAVMQVVYAHYGVPHIFHEIMNAANGTNVVADFILSVFKNPSYMVAIAGGSLLIFPLRRDPFQQDIFLKKIALALFFVAVSIPLLMAAVAKYHIYYSWMAIIPGTVCAFMALEFQSVPKQIRILALCAILAATLPGFPRRCIRIAGTWAQHRSGQIAAVVRKNVSPSDVTFVHGQALAVYYELLPSVSESFWLNPPTNNSVRATVTVVFWPEAGREKEMHEFFGGEWHQADSLAFGREKFKAGFDQSSQIAIYRKE